MARLRRSRSSTCRRLRATALHIGQPALNALDGLHAVKERLVGARVLDDDLGLPVDGQDQGMTGLAQTFDQIDRVALEVTKYLIS